MKKNKQIYFTLLLPILILAACNFPRQLPAGDTLSGTGTPLDGLACYYRWASQPLPELSAQLQSALETAGLTDVSARAEAYGENCLDAQTNQPVKFSALETDFHISLQIADLTRRDQLGILLERILTVLDEFPPDKTPGPQAGLISVSMLSGNEAIYLSFRLSEWTTARAQGLHGAALLDNLQNR